MANTNVTLNRFVSKTATVFGFLAISSEKRREIFQKKNKSGNKKILKLQQDCQHSPG